MHINNIKIEKFIKDHIQEIDKNDFLSLYLNAFDDFSFEDMVYMNEIFESAGIDIKSDRENALSYIITMAVEDWCSGEGGVSQMPLNMFIDAFLDNRLGLYKDEVKTYMFNNRSEWQDDIEITIGTGQVIIKRKFN